MRNKIIVTGHASGIGCHMAMRFHDLGFSVTGLDKNISDNLSSDIEQIICDLSDEESVTRTFRRLDGYAFAVNCAGVSGVRDKITNLGIDDLVNSWEKIFIPTFLSL